MVCVCVCVCVDSVWDKNKGDRGQKHARSVCTCGPGRVRVERHGGGVVFGTRACRVHVWDRCVSCMGTRCLGVRKVVVCAVV